MTMEVIVEVLAVKQITLVANAETISRFEEQKR